MFFYRDYFHYVYIIQCTVVSKTATFTILSDRKNTVDRVLLLRSIDTLGDADNLVKWSSNCSSRLVVIVIEPNRAIVRLQYRSIS